MAEPVLYDDSFVAGDTYNLKVYYKDSAGNPIDIQGYRVDITLRKSMDDDPIFEKESFVTVEDGENGLINVYLDINDTATLIDYCTINKAQFLYDIQLTNVDETEVQTIMWGTFEVFKGVTR